MIKVRVGGMVEGVLDITGGRMVSAPTEWEIGFALGDGHLEVKHIEEILQAKFLHMIKVGVGGSVGGVLEWSAERTICRCGKRVFESMSE